MKYTASSHDTSITTMSRRILICALITLVGVQLRSVVLAVPPIVPLIQHDLHVSYSVIGLLTSIPVFALACAAWPAGLLAERIGARLCVSLGLILLALGALLRATWISVYSLFAFTLLLSLGIVLAQTAIPVLIRRWFPSLIGTVAALFSDGLIIGEAIAAGLTIPLMMQFWGKDGWPETFVFWGIPVVVLLILWLLFAPRDKTRATTDYPIISTSEMEMETVAHEEIHALESKKVRVSALHLGILVGAGSLIYFGANAWVASYNVALHQSSLTALALTLLNSAQLPTSLAVTFFAQQLAGRRLPFIIAGIVCLGAILCLIFLPSLELLWVMFLGGSSALVFTLGIALPPMLAEPHEVGRLTGITISLTYAVAFFGPFAGGTLWDIFHLPAMAFSPVIVASVLLLVLGSFLPSHEAFGLPTRK